MKGPFYYPWLGNLRRQNALGLLWVIGQANDPFFLCLAVKLFPKSLTTRTGGTANFSCTVFNMTGPDYSLNWYKWDDKTQQNTLVQKSRRNDSSHLKGETFLFSLLNVTKNNSGIYFCSLISFHLKEHTITESHKANLTVTGLIEFFEYSNSLSLHIKRTLLLGLSALTSLWSKTMVNIFLSSCCLQEEDPPAVSVYTVDYGVLEFHAADSATRAPPKVFSSDRTEYATIIFPQEKPITVDPDKKNRRANLSLPQPPAVEIL
uniref:Ig-like domain-containing protein n=1 Tax=Salvator merianae TaxID=96440 RepID=A0A8D0DSD3_SALMN